MSILCVEVYRYIYQREEVLSYQFVISIPSHITFVVTKSLKIEDRDDKHKWLDPDFWLFFIRWLSFRADLQPHTWFYNFTFSYRFCTSDFPNNGQNGTRSS